MWEYWEYRRGVFLKTEGDSASVMIAVVQLRQGPFAAEVPPTSEQKGAQESCMSQPPVAHLAVSKSVSYSD